MSKEEILLLSVEDLIHRSIGNSGQNNGYVDFKGVQTILHLLARQMRMLEQKVEIQLEDFAPDIDFTEDDITIDGKQEEKGRKGRKTGKRKQSTSEKRSKDTDETARDEEPEESDVEDIDSIEETATSKPASTTDTEQSRKSSQTKTERGKQSAEKGIAVSEKTSKDEKILVVERKASGSSSGIEVVTRSQFEMLTAAVRELQTLSGPAPAPTLPKNQQLRKDMKEGKAKLADTMNAMNVNARVEAAEAAIERLSSLMTQLTQATGIPENILKMTDDMKRLFPGPEPASPRPSLAQPRRSSAAPRLSAVATSVGIMPTFVTHEEMDVQFHYTREQLLKALSNASDRTSATVDGALSTVRSVGEKMDVALHLDHRISSLYAKVTDYATQLKGFDSGLGIQLQSYQDQMAQMTANLKAGLEIIEKSQNNVGNAAIIELHERFEGLVHELESTSTAHKHLSSGQEQLDSEIKSLAEWVEMLRALKSDRDEVRDALRDKADISRLEGLLSEEKFSFMKEDLEARLQACYDKFTAQEDKWLEAIKELVKECETKADNIALFTMRDEAQRALQALLDLAAALEVQLGEPKAAMLLRKICRDAVCGACAHPAVMPACGDVTAAVPVDPPAAVPLVGHRCNRWVGGSHTLLVPGRVRRRRAPPLRTRTHTRKYCAHGGDGQIYHMEDECLPCVECNPPPSEAGLAALATAADKCTPMPVPISVEDVVLNKDDAQTDAR